MRVAWWLYVLAVAIWMLRERWFRQWAVTSLAVFAATILVILGLGVVLL